MPAPIAEELEQRHGRLSVSWPASPHSIWDEGLIERLNCPFYRQHQLPQKNVPPKVMVEGALNALVELILQQMALARPQSGRESSFAEDIKYYRQNLSRFVERYRGKYIALLNRRVVDEDEDFSKLARRVFRHYGCRDIFMPKVTEKEEMVSIPTPFMGRSPGAQV